MFTRLIIDLNVYQVNDQVDVLSINAASRQVGGQQDSTLKLFQTEKKKIHGNYFSWKTQLNYINLFHYDVK